MKHFTFFKVLTALYSRDTARTHLALLPEIISEMAVDISLSLSLMQVFSQLFTRTPHLDKKTHKKATWLL